MKTEREIESLLDEALEMSDFEGMSYKEGVIAALEYVLGRAQDKPTE